MKDTKKFEEAIYYFEKHKVDMNKICDKLTLYNAFHKVYVEKRLLVFNVLITLAVALFESIFIIDYIKHGGIGAIFCVVAFFVAFVWFMIVAVKEMKDFNYKTHFSKGTSKHVMSLYQDIVKNNYDDFMIFLQNYLTNKK